MMKKFFIPALALAAASVAVPAMAQSYGPQHYGDRDGRYEQYDRDGRYERYDRDGRYDYNRGNSWQNIAQRKYNMDRRIDRSERNGMISRREAAHLRVQLDALVRLERNYMRGGLSYRERMDLDQRYNRLGAMIREERRDRDNRPW